MGSQFIPRSREQEQIAMELAGEYGEVEVSMSRTGDAMHISWEDGSAMYAEDGSFITGDRLAPA
jgi:hypothetical protein